jgi:hypothetical protein
MSLHCGCPPLHHHILHIGHNTRHMFHEDNNTPKRPRKSEQLTLHPLRRRPCLLLPLLPCRLPPPHLLRSMLSQRSSRHHNPASQPECPASRAQLQVTARQSIVLCIARWSERCPITTRQYSGNGEELSFTNLIARLELPGWVGEILSNIDQGDALELADGDASDTASFQLSVCQ